jgi:protoporphyrinogen/coproporphyrinogen III oxidase
MSAQPDVIVVGGGLGGLFIACELKRRGGRPLLLEAEDTAGGVATTVAADGYQLEPAAGSFLLPHRALSPILDAAHATVRPAEPSARRRFVYNRNELFELAGPRAAATGLVTTAGKLRLLREPWLKSDAADGDESLEQFLVRRVGPEAGQIVAHLMAHGVFAADPSRLSARAAFPALVALGDETGSLIRGAISKRRQRPQGHQRPSVHVAGNTMMALAAELATYLGTGFRPGWKVEDIVQEVDGLVVNGPGEERARSVVVALAPHAAARVVPEYLRSLLGEAVAAPVAIVGLGGPSADMPLPTGFGALTGPESDLRALGLLFESSYAPHRAPARHRLLKCIYGGAADPSAYGLSDEDLVALATEEASKVIGVAMLPSWTHVARQSPGIPQFNVGHLEWLSRLQQHAAELPGLHFGGWGYRAIGLTALAEDASRLADILTRD